MELDQKNDDQKSTEVENGKNIGIEDNAEHLEKTEVPAWISQLPKYLRENAELVKFDKLSDFAIKYLNDLEKTSTQGADVQNVTKKHKDEEYEELKKYFSNSNDFNGKRDSSLFELLKESDVDPKSLQAVLSMKPSEEDVQVLINSAIAKRAEELKKIWKDKYDSENEYLTRALQDMSKEETSNLESSGLLYNAEFAKLLAENKRLKSLKPSPRSYGANENSSIADIMGWNRKG